MFSMVGLRRKVYLCAVIAFICFADVALAAELPCADIFYFSKTDDESREQLLLLSLHEFLKGTNIAKKVLIHKETGKLVIFLPAYPRELEHKNSIEEVESWAAKYVDGIRLERTPVKVRYSAAGHTILKFLSAITFTGQLGSAAVGIVAFMGVLPRAAPGATDVLLVAATSALGFTLSHDTVRSYLEDFERAKNNPLDNSKVIAEIEDAILARLSEDSNAPSVVVVVANKWMKTYDLEILFRANFSVVNERQIYKELTARILSQKKPSSALNASGRDAHL